MRYLIKSLAPRSVDAGFGWIVVDSGAVLGVYEGETPEEAIEAMDRDAGYHDSAHAAAWLGTTVARMRADLSVSELVED